MIKSNKVPQLSAIEDVDGGVEARMHAPSPSPCARARYRGDRPSCARSFKSSIKFNGLSNQRINAIKLLYIRCVYGHTGGREVGLR